MCEIVNNRLNISLSVLELAKHSKQISDIIEGYEDDDEHLQSVYTELSKEVDLNDVNDMNITDGYQGMKIWEFIFKYDFDNKTEYVEKIKTKLTTSQQAFSDMC